MKIYSVYDPEFRRYGQIVEGLDPAVREILAELEKTPVCAGTSYVPLEPALQELPAMTEISEHLFGGMPIQLGWCNGFNTKLNCLEYHRDSEFNLGTRDFVLLLGKQEEIENGVFDTAKVKAFRVPAGIMVECFATTLHYAPCHTDPKNGFQFLVALPAGTNTERPEFTSVNREDILLQARNKWLLAHKDAPEAASGAYIGLVGENWDIEKDIL